MNRVTKRNSEGVARKILSIAEIISSIGLLFTSIILLVLRNAISYEEVPVFEKTPQSSIFTIIEYHPIIGYLLVMFGVILFITTTIELCYMLKYLDD